jgi:hypothetical protein
MKKTTLKENISALKKLSTRMPKSINEAINFNEMEGDDELGGIEDEPMDEPMDKPMDKPMETEEPNIDGFIANMRKESLGIMKKLADDPDNAVYQFAKKIFQLADKAHEDQKEGKDINGQPKQQMMPQQGHMA